MSANDTQQGGGHYRLMDPQPWDVTIQWVEQGHIGHPEATIIEYLARWRNKNGVADLLKAKHWLEKLIEESERILASDQGRRSELDAHCHAQTTLST